MYTFSASFFAVYINDAIEKISKLNIGCKIESIAMNIIAFADDIALVAPTVTALQQMIDILNSEFFNLNLKFNPDKCVIMNFNRCCKKFDKMNFPIYMNNTKLKYVDEFEYLGFKVDTSLSNQSDISRARNKFYSTFNTFIRKFHFINTA